jgi:hypothetical protein
MPMYRFFDLWGFGFELFYTIAIVVFCYLIYAKTKEMYELTKHKGIKFFRNTFLFFGLAYAFRLLLHLIMIGTITMDLMPRMAIMPFSIVVVSYLSTMAIFYLTYSTIWKSVKGNHLIIISNIFAITFSIVAFITRSQDYLILLQLGLLIFALVMSYKTHKSKRFSNIRILYFLILIFWVLNLYFLGPRMRMPYFFNLGMHIISLIVFWIIYLKVKKWAK